MGRTRETGSQCRDGGDIEAQPGPGTSVVARRTGSILIVSKAPQNAQKVRAELAIRVLRERGKGQARLKVLEAEVFELFVMYFQVSCACSPVRPHCSGCPFPSPHLKVLESATQGHSRERRRDLRAAQGNPQDMP
jgi:hypothetical protein